MAKAKKVEVFGIHFHFIVTVDEVQINPRGMCQKIKSTSNVPSAPHFFILSNLLSTHIVVACSQSVCILVRYCLCSWCIPTQMSNDTFLNSLWCVKSAKWAGIMHICFMVTPRPCLREWFLETFVFQWLLAKNNQRKKKHIYIEPLQFACQAEFRNK